MHSRAPGHHLVAALTLATLLVFPTASCSNLDDFVEDAQDVVKDAANAAKEAAGSVGDDETDGPHPSTRPDGPEKPTGTLSTGPQTVFASQVVDASGGSVKVQKPGDPLDGMEIQVPAGSYDGARQFNVSSAPVSGQSFGEHFSPVTPLISIDNGGEYSEHLMTVRIPVDVPPDHFAMAFYYDEEKGSLEGIPFSSIESDSITIVTRHFSKLLVSIIRNTVLDDLLKKGIDSGFRPGADDWQFTNRGSYVVPNGHCAGQSISAMWYYCEKPDGSDAFLWGLYDNNGNEPSTPDLWKDDSFSYRFASTVQEDIDWDSFAVQFQMQIRGKDDAAHSRAFAYAILLTGEPQFVGIASSAGGGHAMVVYRVYKNSLYIADPNYPGNLERRIELINGQFKPYKSGANADAIEAGHGEAYESIGYHAKSSMVDWSRIAERWSEFKAGTIGNDRFPQYDIVLLDDQGQETPLLDGYESPEKKIRVQVNCGVNTGRQVYLNGVMIQPDAQGKYELEDGDNLLGIVIFGDVNDNPQAPRYSYVDFQYFHITYGQPDCYGWVLESVTPSITPNPGGDARFFQDFTFDVTEGSYTSEGRIVIPMLEEDSVAHFRHTGGWSPLPDCIKANETITVTISAASALEIIPPVDWGSVFNSIVMSLDLPQAELGRINLESRFEVVPGMSTRRIELTLGDGSDGASHEVIVRFNTETGTGEYRYKYVWVE